MRSGHFAFLAALHSVSAVSAPAPGLAAPSAIFNLGTLGGTESYATGINAGGQVIGVSKTQGDTATHAFLYTGTPGSGGVMHDLGALRGNASRGLACLASAQLRNYMDTGAARSVRSARSTQRPFVLPQAE